MSSEQSFLAQNDASRERLKTLIGQLTDEQLNKPIGHGWTVASALAHLAFWDYYALETLTKWEREGISNMAADPDPINDAALHLWLAMPAKIAAAQAIAAAEAVDQKILSLPPEFAQAILASPRPRMVARTLHRNGHLDEIEQALG